MHVKLYVYMIFPYIWYQYKQKGLKQSRLKAQVYVGCPRSCTESICRGIYHTSARICLCRAYAVVWVSMCRENLCRSLTLHKGRSCAYIQGLLVIILVFVLYIYFDPATWSIRLIFCKLFNKHIKILFIVSERLFQYGLPAVLSRSCIVRSIYLSKLLEHILASGFGS